MSGGRFQVSDEYGEPPLCCNRTEAEPQCISMVPLVDRLFQSCTIVQLIDPFEAFDSARAAPLLFLLQHPGSITSTLLLLLLVVVLFILVVAALVVVVVLLLLYLPRRCDKY